MAWNNLIFLSLGIGLGGVVGWWWRRFAEGRLTPTVISGPQASTSSSLLDSANPDAMLQPTLQDQLQRMQLAYSMATEMSQFKGGFLARSAHELRSPLNGIISLHQLILADLCDNPEEEREFVAQAHDYATKTLALLDEAIAVSKLEHGRTSLQIQPIQLVAMFQELYELTHLLAQNRNLRLDIQPPDPDLYVLADPRWLRQILLNLVTTPIALMEAGTIRVSSHVLSAHQVSVEIEDERSPAAWQESVDLFPPPSLPTQTEPATVGRSLPASPPTPSAGLTLLSTQTLLELMQGQLKLVSRPGPSGDDAENNPTRIQCILPLASELDE